MLQKTLALKTNKQTKKKNWLRKLQYLLQHAADAHSIFFTNPFWEISAERLAYFTNYP